MTPTDLLAKMEEAECGSPALDREIMILDGWTLDEVSNPTPMWIAPPGRKFPYGSARNVTAVSDCYPYTRIVDAALSLVPEGWFIWHVGQTEAGDDWQVILRGPAGAVDIEIIGTTLSLVICSAALRAPPPFGLGR